MSVPGETGAEGAAGRGETAPFRRMIPVRDLPARAARPIFETATAAETEAIAEDFALRAVERLDVEAALSGDGRSGWRLKGRLRARIVQNCVVTLAPVTSDIDEPFERLYVPGRASDPFQTEIVIDPDEDDPPEPLGDGIDLGAVALETLALSIEPYPRAPGVHFEGRSATPPGAEELNDEALKPFASLAELKRRLERGGD